MFNDLRERSFLLTLLLGLGFLSLAVPVHASPAISISNFQFPSTVIFNKPITASYTVDYSGAVIFKEWLSAAILDSPQKSLAVGSILNSSPNNCQQFTGTTITYSEAGCYFYINASQGSENVAFSLTISSVGTYSFIARAVLNSYSTSGCSFEYSTATNVCIDADAGDTPFSVSVIDKFTLTVSVPDKITVTLDGVQENPGYVTSQLNPGSHTISVPNIVQIDSTSRLRFDGWVDGQKQTTRTFDLEDDTNFGATYVIQYRLSLASTQMNATGAGWYDADSVATFSLLSNRYQFFWVFEGWYENVTLVTSSPSGSITMNGPHTFAARWGLDYALLGSIVGAVAVLALGLAYYARKLPKLAGMPAGKKRRRRRVKRSQTVAETVEPATIPETKTPAPETTKLNATEKTGIFCTQCGARLTRDSKFCKECGARIT